MAIFHISHIHELYMHNIDKFNLHYKVGKQIIFETSLLEKQILNRSVLTTGFFSSSSTVHNVMWRSEY